MTTVGKARIAYLHGRPHGHPLHATYANSVGAAFHFVDPYLPYHERESETPRIVRYLSWLMTATLFPAHHYDLLLTEDVYHAARWMRTIRRRKVRLVTLVASHTPYFMYTDRLGSRSRRRLVDLYLSYDALICVSPMLADLMVRLAGESIRSKLHVITNCVSPPRFEQLRAIKPNLSSRRIVTIAGAQNPNRSHYKGLDLMVSAFAQLALEDPDLEYRVVGEVCPEIQRALLASIDPRVRTRVQFVAHTTDIASELANAGLYWHLARGEAWGIAVNEAMLSGVPAIVSEWTGARMVVEEVDPALVLPLDPTALAQATVAFLSRPTHERLEVANRARQAASRYTVERSVSEFRTAIQAVLDLEIPEAAQ